MNAFENFLGWLEKRVDQRMHEGLGGRRLDLLQYFINGKTPDGNPVMKAAKVMIEGTAFAILAVMSSLLVHDDALQRVRDELDKAVADFVRNFDAKVFNKKQPWVTKSQWFSFPHHF